MRDELEQLLDDDDDMADLYLSRKMAGASPVSGSGAANWFPASPTIGSKISRASRASLATIRGDENDVEELEMLLEVITLISFTFVMLSDPKKCYQVRNSKLVNNLYCRLTLCKLIAHWINCQQYVLSFFVFLQYIILALSLSCVILNVYLSICCI